MFEAKQKKIATTPTNYYNYVIIFTHICKFPLVAFNWYGNKPNGCVNQLATIAKIQTILRSKKIQTKWQEISTKNMWWHTFNMYQEQVFTQWKV